LPPLTVIPLGRPLLNGSSDLPGSLAPRAETHRMRASHSFPIWSCSVWGLPCPVHYCAGGALLPHLFTLTTAEAVAVCSLWHFPSHGLEPMIPDVIRHIALRSSDFPLSSPRGPGNPAFAARQRPSDPAPATSIIRLQPQTRGSNPEHLSHQLPQPSPCAWSSLCKLKRADSFSAAPRSRMGR
jgi:hypothetical protein